MLFLFNSEYEVAGDHVGYLLGLPLKDHLVAVLHAPLNLHIQRLHIVYNLATLAVRTVGSGDLASAAAPVTGSLHLHLHAEADLDLLHHDTLASALRALLGLAVLGPGPPALRTVDVARNRHVPGGPQVQLLERDPHVCACLRALLSLVPAPLQPLEPLEALLVVHLSLVLVTQHLVGSVHLLEGTRGLFIARVLVRVVLEGELAEGALDISLRGVTGDLE